jgi:hypothetical protein
MRIIYLKGPSTAEELRPTHTYQKTLNASHGRSLGHGAPIQSPTAESDSDFDWFPDNEDSQSRTILEQEPADSVFTGLYTPEGQRILRSPIPRNPIGFLAEIYDVDPEECFMYTLAPDEDE